MALTDKLTAIGNAIRNKTGGSSQLSLTEMATAISNIQTGITPSGSINISQNGTYDVTNKANAVVAVPFNSKCFSVNISETQTGEISLNPNGDSDIAAHYTDNSFCVALFRLGEANELSALCIVEGNVNLRTGATAYGVLLRASSDGTAMATLTKAVSAASTRTGGTLTVDSSGVVSVYASNTIKLAAGNYIVVCGW